jgi:hypothetical protein
MVIFFLYTVMQAHWNRKKKNNVKMKNSVKIK